MGRRYAEHSDFGAAFTALLAAARMNVDGVRRALPGLVGRSTLYDWLKGEHLPEDPGPLLQVIRVCLDAAGRSGSQLGDAPSTETGWLQLLAHAKQARSSRAGPEIGGLVLAEMPERDALLYGVHPALTVRGAGKHAEAHRLLPPYLLRQHDKELRAGLLAARDGDSTVIMLIGESSTGKTRACWEAIQTELPAWRLWHPSAPEDLIEAIRAGRVEPRTVIWLDEAQRYLRNPGVGERAAAALQDLLHRPQAGPIVVLGSMWRSHWVALTEEAGQEHQAARALLQHRDVAVPFAFTVHELAEAASQIGSDPRLAAASAQGGGRITQWLAGAPELTKRYQRADEYSKAIVWAAIDASRLSPSWLWLPRDFLYEAAPGYLDRSVWNTTRNGDSWFTESLAELAKPGLGIPGPLEPHRGLPGQPPARDEYRLADILLEIGYTERAGYFPPGTFWDSVQRECGSPAVLVELSEAAAHRGRYRRKYQMLRAAADLGDSDAALNLAWFREGAGDKEGAESLFASAAELGNTRAMGRLVWYRERAGDKAGAERFAERAAEFGDNSALAWLAEDRERTGDIAAAERLAEQAASRGETDALAKLAKGQYYRGDRSGAERMYRRAFEYGNNDVVWQLAELLPRQAVRLYRQAADRGDIRALGRLFESRQKAGDMAGMERLAQQAADLGDPSFWRRLANRAERAKDLTRAERLYQQAIDNGDKYAIMDLATLREKAGKREAADRLIEFAESYVPRQIFTWYGDSVHIQDSDGDQPETERLSGYMFSKRLNDLAMIREKAGDQAGAERLARQAANYGSIETLSKLVELRAKNGEQVAAQHLAERAVDMGYIWPLRRLIELREKAGDTAGAECLAQWASERGRAGELTQLANSREDRGKHAAAEKLYEQAAAQGDSSAMVRLAQKWERSGNQADAEELYRRAADQGEVEPGLTALMRLAMFQERSGERDAAERLALEALEYDTRAMARQIYDRSATGYYPSPALLRNRILLELVIQRDTAGMHSDAERLARQAADCGTPEILLTLAEHREQSRDPQGALRLCLLAANYDCPGALDHVAGLLEQTGRQLEAEQLRRNGLADDEESAYVAAPWIWPDSDPASLHSDKATLSRQTFVASRDPGKVADLHQQNGIDVRVAKLLAAPVRRDGISSYGRSSVLKPTSGNTHPANCSITYRRSSGTPDALASGNRPESGHLHAGFAL